MLEDRVKKLVLVEPDKDTFSFLQKKFRSKNTILVNKCIEDYQTDIVFDIIYTASPSNWMCLSPWSGIPDAFTRFIKTNLSSDGIFFARIYGGLHKGCVLQSRAYAEELMDSFKKSGLKVISYAYRAATGHQAPTGFLVVGRAGSQLAASDMPFGGLGTVTVKDGRFVASIKIPLKTKMRRAFGLLLYLPVHILYETARMLRNVVYLVKINAKLLEG